jgi:hypothetical protein
LTKCARDALISPYLVKCNPGAQKHGQRQFSIFGLQEQRLLSTTTTHFLVRSTARQMAHVDRFDIHADGLGGAAVT